MDNEIKLFQQANPKIKINKTTQLFANYQNLYTLAQGYVKVSEFGQKRKAGYLFTFCIYR